MPKGLSEVCLSYIEEGQAMQWPNEKGQNDKLADHRTKPGTAIQCKTKDSSCHRQSSVQVLSGIRAAQTSVFCVVFCRPLFIIYLLKIFLK
jgi:hypothetical protein